MPITRSFETLRSEGGLLPADLLQRINDPSSRLDGMRPEDYGLPSGERLTEAVTQSWNRLRKYWADFASAREGLAAGEAGTGVTNDKWSLPLLRELGFGPLPAGAGREVNGQLFAISRFVGVVPVHLVGAGVDLDRRTSGVRGAATASPHGILQEFLNREPASQWGVVCNGLQLRILRDNHALSRPSYFEADLEAMFGGEQFGEFSLLWYVAHHSRFAPREGKGPDSCWLEQWTKLVEEQGTRALKELRVSVQKALLALGQGFTSHPQNVALREALRSGALSPTELHGQLLRVVYRLIILFVAEDRTLDGQALLHPTDDRDVGIEARGAYARHFSTARLRDMAARIRGSRHGDLWRQHQTVVAALSGQPEGAAARAALALPALGSFLWSPASTPALNEARLSNHDFLEALRHLAFTIQDRQRRAVDYRSLGAEELGGVYEGLLALTPQVGSDGATFTFVELAGNERKTSGSYYTPDSLVRCLLDSALDPVVHRAIEGKNGDDAARAILQLKVCDPAVGSGHFLVGAAHRLARHLARVRANAAGEGEPSPRLYLQSLRDVIGRCLYGVDINPMSAELCRVSLWLEALEPGKPLSFLEHHIRVGNSLVGATPQMIASGIPDTAYSSTGTDEPSACAELKARNSAQRDRPSPLFASQEKELQDRLAQAAMAIEELPDATPENVNKKELLFRAREDAPAYQLAKHLADTWCAASFIQKTFSSSGHPNGITQQSLDALSVGRSIGIELEKAVRECAANYQFFHWHLAFPEVTARGGFDCVLSNPPWELMEAPSGERASDAYARLQHWYRSSQYAVLHGRRDLYKLFLVESSAEQLSPTGRLGMLVPIGVFIEEDSAAWRKSFYDSGSVIRLLHFQNAGKKFFDHVHGSYRFCAVTYSREIVPVHEFSPVITQPSTSIGSEVISISRQELDAVLGPQRAAVSYQSEAQGRLHRTMADTGRSRGCVEFDVVSEFHASTDKRMFTADGWAVLKNRNIHLYDPQFAPYEEWVSAPDVQERLRRKGLTSEKWITEYVRLVFRDIARGDDERTLIACLVAPGAVSTYDTPMIVPRCSDDGLQKCMAFVAAAMSSLAVDFLVRPLVDKHVKRYVLSRVPILSPRSVAPEQLSWFLSRVVELVCNDERFLPFSRACTGGEHVFRKDEQRRSIIKAELDAAFLWLYLSPEPFDVLGRSRRHDSSSSVHSDMTDAASAVLDSFEVMRRGEIKEFGAFKTKRLVLERLEAIEGAVRAGRPYRSPLEPPPGLPFGPDGEFLEHQGNHLPSNIHLPRGGTRKRGELLLSDLEQFFPNESVTVRVNVGVSGERIRVQPAIGVAVTNGERVVLAHRDLRVGAKSVPVAVGTLRIDARRDAATDEEYLVVSVKADDGGVAQVKLRPDEWASLRTVGRVLEN
jgi:hypothetical protein